MSPSSALMVAGFTTPHILAQMGAPITGLSTSGIVMMVLSIGLVTFLAGFCIYHILREPAPSSRHHAPLEIDTRDE